ncbi:hypothetical protein Purlil1_12071 [Purpureocillium lilacinum]|uniref:Fungal-type protein kinase domain-containing protein n=1 Tax=Purpureocillium lilacinum TaxID=33203 RepID=A0ABR0BI48_PURLI|nr:hypothetical protein Purlil1_12071 [Purpureocillium lilacinum]
MPSHEVAVPVHATQTRVHASLSGSRRAITKQATGRGRDLTSGQVNSKRRQTQTQSPFASTNYIRVMSLTERIRWRPPEKSSLVSAFERRCRKAKQQRFLDERLMEERNITCTWSDLTRPMLKRCGLPGSITFVDLIGYGLDGIVWKVKMNNQVSALKVFWDTKAPEGTRYWAVQRECQNASLLQMIQFATEQYPDSIWLNPNPTSFSDAVRNLHAFSDEGRQRKRFRDVPGAINHTSTPRLRECFGWTTVAGGDLCALQPDVRPPRVHMDGRPRGISPNESYYAILYELLPDDTCALVADVLQSQLDFFWLCGFCLVPLRSENWKGPGILLDLADLICPWQAGWFSSTYRRRRAQEITQSVSVS